MRFLSHWTGLSSLVPEAATGRLLETVPSVPGAKHPVPSRYLVLCALFPIGRPLGIECHRSSLRRSIFCRSAEKGWLNGRHLPVATIRRPHIQPDIQSLSLEPGHPGVGPPLGGPSMSSSLSPPRHHDSRPCSPVHTIIWSSFGRIWGNPLNLIIHPLFYWHSHPRSSWGIGSRQLSRNATNYAGRNAPTPSSVNAQASLSAGSLWCGFPRIPSANYPVSLLLGAGRRCQPVGRVICGFVGTDHVRASLIETHPAPS